MPRLRPHDANRAPPLDTIQSALQADAAPREHPGNSPVLCVLTAKLAPRTRIGVAWSNRGRFGIATHPLCQPPGPRRARDLEADEVVRVVADPRHQIVRPGAMERPLADDVSGRGVYRGDGDGAGPIADDLEFVGVRALLDRVGCVPHEHGITTCLALEHRGRRRGRWRRMERCERDSSCLAEIGAHARAQARARAQLANVEGERLGHPSTEAPSRRPWSTANRGARRASRSLGDLPTTWRSGALSSIFRSRRAPA